MTIQTEIDENRPLPKSLRHWAGRAGFYPPKLFGHHRTWRRDGVFFARSRRPEHLDGCLGDRRYIRVLPHIARMDICDGAFDRWANSLAASVPMPTTETEFRAALATLLSKSRQRARRAAEEAMI